MCELVPSLPPPPRPAAPSTTSSTSVVSSPVAAAMCNSGPQPAGALVSAAAAAAYHGLKVPSHAASPFVFHPSMTQAAFDFHRAQLYDYNARLHFGLRAAGYGHAGAGALTGYSPHGPHDPLAHYYQAKYDPRARFVHEEPKPSHSYIGLIAMAILASKEMKLVLADIYQWILDNYVYFRNRGPGWRNSIRHNLSLNDCFIKAGRSANGKGHYWAVHPANVEDFKKGDFRRRRAQRKVRRHMGLSVPDDEDSPSPPPPANTDTSDWAAKALGAARDHDDRQSQQQAPRPDSVTSGSAGGDVATSPMLATSPMSATSPTGCAPVGLIVGQRTADASTHMRSPPSGCGKKRLFDVESLLAPETTDYHFRPSFESATHPAKMARTTMMTTTAAIVIRPENNGGRSRSPLSIDVNDRRDIDVEADDENIDVEDVGDADDEVISVCCKPEVKDESHNGTDGVERRSSSSPAAHRRTSTSSRHDDGSRPASPRDDSRHSPLSSRASPPQSTTPSRASSPSDVDTIIRTPGSSLALQTQTHPGQQHPHAHLAAVRGPWGGVPGAAAAALVGAPAGWRDGHPSAFHSTAVGGGAGGGPATPAVAASLSAWTGVGPHGFPLMSAASFPGSVASSPAEALAAQQRWQETFSRMMARPIDHSKNNVKSEA